MNTNRDEFKYIKEEKIKVVLLNTKNRVCKIVEVVSGGSNCVNVTLSAILKEAIKSSEPKMILIHNHPSGDPEPSKQDILLTKSLYNMTKVLGIQLLDHIVIGHNKYESIFARRDFKNEIMGL